MTGNNLKRKKISSRAGESIAETLIALLISSLALVMLASMIQSTVSIVSKSEDKMDEYYLANAVLEETNGSKTAKIVFTQVTSLQSEPKIVFSVENVPYQKNPTFSDNPVLSYSPPALS